MDNFDLKKYLVENKVTTNSRMMKEYFEKETKSLAQAFAQAGIDMSTPVEVVEAGGGPGGSMGARKQMDPKALLQMLEREKASFDEDSDEGEEVVYDFEAGEGYPGAKLAVMFGDQYEYVIYQAANSKMINEEAEYVNFEEGTGFYEGTVGQTKIYTMEDSSIGDTMLYALDTQGEVEYVAIDVSGEKVTPKHVQEEAKVSQEVASFIANNINSQLED